MTGEYKDSQLLKLGRLEVDQERLDEYRRVVAGKVPYIIYFTPRSGSSFLSDMLTKSLEMGTPGEFFTGSLFEIALQHMRVLGYTGDSVVDYLIWLINNTSSPNGVFGFKANYFDHAPLIESGLQELLFGNYKAVFLYRKNILKQAISLYVATETGLFHTNIPVANETLNAARSLKYDGEQLREWIRHIWIQEIGWKDYLSKIEAQPLVIGYDLLSANPKAAVEMIAERLGVRLSNLPDKNSSVFEKVRTENNDNLAEQFLGDPSNKDFFTRTGIEGNRLVGE